MLVYTWYVNISSSQKATKNVSAEAILSLFQSLPGKYLILKSDAPQFTIAAVSDLYTQAMELNRNDILGKSIFEILPDNPAGFKNITKSLMRVLKKKQPSKMVVTNYYSEKQKRKNGEFEIQPLNVLHSPVFDTNNKVAFIVHSVVDIPQSALTGKRDTVDKKSTMQLLFADLLEAQKRLQESEERYRLVVEHAMDLISLIDMKGTIIFASPSWKRITGFTPEEAVYKNAFSFIHPQDLAITKEGMAKALKGEVATVEEYRLKHKNGDWIIMEGSGSAVFDEKGKPLFIVTISRDITERKQAEERQKFLEAVSSKLVTSFDNFLTLQDIAKLIISHIADYCRIAIVDDTGHIREIAVRHSDKSKVSMAKDLYESYKDSAESTHGIQKILETGKAEIIEKVDKSILSSVKNNTKLLTIVKQIGLKSYMGAPLIARGKVIGAITFSSVKENRYYSKKDLKLAKELAQRIALYLDNARLLKEAQAEIRERKQAEDNLSFLAEASRILSSSLNYKTTLSNIAKLAVPKIADWCSIEILDEKGVLEQVAVAHKDPKKVKWAKELRKISPPDMSQQTGIPHVIRTGKTEYYPKITDEMLVKIAKNKKQLKLLRDIGFNSAIIAPLCREGRCIGGITFVTTETKRHYTKVDLSMVEEIANRASVALENAGFYKASQDAVNLRDNFISVASHELKTPITSVKIFTEVMQQHSKQIGDKKALEHLTKMNKQLDKLTELIYNMLNISKIQAGRLEFNQKLFDFDGMVYEIVDVLQQGTPKHKIEIDGKTQKKIYGDEDRIGQVLSNLVSNAIKYSPKADKIVIHLSSTKDNVTVCVEDFGIGLAREHTKRIFERFYRVFDTTDKTFPGLGIGLYISSEIIKRHHGTLWVESNIGKGSKFYFSLPIKKDKKPNGVQVL